MTDEDHSVTHHLAHPMEDAEPLVERILFGNRFAVIVLFILATGFLAFAASKLRLDASFEKMIPATHPYIVNFFKNRDDLKGLGNLIRVSVETKDEDIFDKNYLETLKGINDELFYIKGVDRSGLKSLWTPNTRWTEVTEEGLAGGQVIPSTYDGSAESLELVRRNVLRSGQVGRIVGNDFKSTIIVVPLLEIDPDTGEALDYRSFSRKLETLIRDKYSSETIEIHITGFAKVVGDLIEGATQVAVFFAAAFVITMVLLFLYSRCIKSTVVTLACSLVAVVWQLGLLEVLEFGLNPFSMLVPFLVFAIGVSHGVQIVNAIAHGSMNGLDRENAARYAFRSLYIAGLTALVSDGIGFATLLIIEISVIRDLAIAASIGVATIILTNLVLLPIIMSYVGVSQKSVRRLQSQEAGKHAIWSALSNFTKPGFAVIALVCAAVLFAFGSYKNQELKIGDLDQGAPELRPDSRYNKDNKYIVDNYSASTDVFVVMVQTPASQCISYDALSAIDYFQWYMEGTPGVQSTASLANRTKRVISAMNEGSLKWMGLSRNQFVLNGTVGGQQDAVGLFNSDCSLVPILIYLEDHKAETLESVVAAVEQFNREYDTDAVEFVMAAGNGGIEAATNIVVAQAQYEILLWVYGVVSFLVLLAFRSLRAVFCIITPLALTSVLAQALMVYLGIGVKVATLPVIALGVGIGVDYGIYIYTKLEAELVKGLPLREAYFETLKTTGKAVVFTGLTLAIGVATWAWSPIKFQADMGIMLTFMFLWNMLGAVVLLPALARYIAKPDKLMASKAARQHAEMASA